MTLVNRVSAFFLGALAVALVVYSGLFYFLMRDYLYREFDTALHNALHILTASVEIESDDVKWHPAEHGIDLSQQILNDVIWIVCDERNQVIDRSPRMETFDPTYQPVLQYAGQSHITGQESEEKGPWRMLQKEMSAPAPKPQAQREPHEFARIRVTVARSQAELVMALRQLVLLVCILPLIVLLAAATSGGWFVRQALKPIRGMAERARSMTHADFGLRLPVGQSRDELADLGQAFNRLLDQLQEAFNRQYRFTGDAAHQLRTPLAVLRGQLDVARRRRRTTDEYERTLDVLIAQTTELAQIVDSLLYLARSENEPAHVDTQLISLYEWLPKYMARFDRHPRRRDLAVQCETESCIFASAPLFAQLLDNLLGNAFKYSQPGTPVELGVMREGERVVVSVKDQGIGILPSDRCAIFDPFFRAESVRRAGYPGTGLGLSVAAQIAAVFNAELSCESIPGRGSTFTVQFPTGVEASERADDALASAEVA